MKHVVRGGGITCFDRLLELRHANFEITVSHEQSLTAPRNPPQLNALNGTSRAHSSARLVHSQGVTAVRGWSTTRSA